MTAIEFLKELDAHVNDQLDPYKSHVDAAHFPTPSPKKLRVMEVLISCLRDEAHRHPELVTFATQLDMLLESE